MDLTPQQKRKLLSAAEIVDKGDVAVLEKLLEFEDIIEEKASKIDESLSMHEEEMMKMKGKCEEVIEKASAVTDGKQGDKGEKGDPGIGKDGKDGRDGTDGLDGINGLDGKDGKDGKDAEMPNLEELAITTVNYIETLEGDDKLSMKAIKDLPEKIKQLENYKPVALPPTTTHFFRDGIDFGRAKNIEFVYSKVEVVGDKGYITPITVSATEPSNPFLNMLWLDIS